MTRLMFGVALPATGASKGARPGLPAVAIAGTLFTILASTLALPAQGPGSRFVLPRYLPDHGRVFRRSGHRLKYGIDQAGASQKGEEQDAQD
jgi:hypothetical protein